MKYADTVTVVLTSQTLSDSDQHSYYGVQNKKFHSRIIDVFFYYLEYVYYVLLYNTINVKKVSKNSRYW